MKIFIAFLMVMLSLQATGQDLANSDSIEVRVLNKGKYYLKEHVITIAGHDYKFENLWENKFSEYQRMPYLWPTNKSKTTVVIKRIIKYDEWITSLRTPIDHVGDKKLLSGKYTIEVWTKKKGVQLEVENKIIRE